MGLGLLAVPSLGHNLNYSLSATEQSTYVKEISYVSRKKKKIFFYLFSAKIFGMLHLRNFQFLFSWALLKINECWEFV